MSCVVAELAELWRSSSASGTTTVAASAFIFLFSELLRRRLELRCLQESSPRRCTGHLHPDTPCCASMLRGRSVSTSMLQESVSCFRSFVGLHTGHRLFSSGPCPKQVLIARLA